MHYFCIISLVFLSLAGLAREGAAETKPFIHEVDQPFSGSQSPDEARVAALAKAKMEVIEKAGTYMESITIVENFILTRDEIIAIAAGVLKTEIISQKNYATENGFGIVMVSKIELNTDRMKERMAKLLEDRTVIEKYHEIQAREKELLATIARLEEQNKRLQTDVSESAQVGQEALAEELGETIRALPATEWNRRAISYWKEGKYTDPEKAIMYLDKSIGIDPENPKSYNNRGAAYFSVGLLKKALDDYNKAIALDAAYVAAYNNRGITRYKLQQYSQALADFDKVIAYKPEMVEAYLNRGAVYKNLFQYRLALRDFKQVRNLDPHYAKDLKNQGTVLISTNEVAGLCEKARMACDLGLCRALTFLQERQFCEGL